MRLLSDRVVKFVINDHSYNVHTSLADVRPRCRVLFILFYTHTHTYIYIHTYIYTYMFLYINTGLVSKQPIGKYLILSYYNNGKNVALPAYRWQQKCRSVCKRDKRPELKRRAGWQDLGYWPIESGAFLYSWIIGIKQITVSNSVTACKTYKDFKR